MPEYTAEQYRKLASYWTVGDCGTGIDVNGPVQSDLIQDLLGVEADGFGPHDVVGDLERAGYGNVAAIHMENNRQFFTHKNVPVYMWEDGIFDVTIAMLCEATSASVIQAPFSDGGGWRLQWGGDGTNLIFRLYGSGDGNPDILNIIENGISTARTATEYRFVGTGFGTDTCTMYVNGEPFDTYDITQQPVSDYSDETMTIGYAVSNFTGYLGGWRCQYQRGTYTVGDFFFEMEEQEGAMLFNALADSQSETPTASHAILNPLATDPDMVDLWEPQTNILPSYSQLRGCTEYNIDVVQKVVLIPDSTAEIILWASAGSLQYDFRIDWGDGTPIEVHSGTGTEIRSNTGARHSYAGADAATLFTVLIYGAFPRINCLTSSGTNRPQWIMEVGNLGVTNLTALFGAFNGAYNMYYFVAGDTRTAKLSRMDNAFYNCGNLESFGVGLMSFASVSGSLTSQGFIGFFGGDVPEQQAQILEADYNALMIRIEETCTATALTFDAPRCTATGAGADAVNALRARGWNVNDLTPEA